MPQALAFVLPAVFGATGTVALVTAAGTLTVAGVAATIGGSLLVSQLSRPDTPEAARPENVQITTKNAVAVRMRHYGIVKVGGNVVFHRAASGISYRLVVHGHGEITDVLQHYLNNEPVSLDSAGFVTDEQYQYKRPRVQILGRSGLVPSAHYPEISAIWDEWTAQHRLDGLWTSLVVAESVGPEQYRAMYPRGEPDISVLAETTKCLDPRTGERAFTENMALCIGDLIASPDGFNRPDALDMDDLMAQADICDRVVSLATGGTEPMWRASGSYLLNEKPQAVLSRMLAACAGRIQLKPSGKVRLSVGAWSPPEMTLTYADIIEVQEVNSGPDLLDRYNTLPARFNSHDLGHVEVDVEPWSDADRIAEDGEVLVGEVKSLLVSPSSRQTRQAMSIHIERDNPKLQASITFKPKAFPAIYEGVIALDIPELDLVGPFEVEEYSCNLESGLLRAVSLKLRLIDPSVFSLSLADQGTVQVLPEPDTPAGVPLPQNVTAAAAGVQTTMNAFVAGIAIGWSAPPSDALAPRVRLSDAGGGNKLDIAVGPEATSVSIPGLVDGRAYDVSVAFVTPGGVVGDAVVVENVVALAVTDPPAPPTSLVVSDAGGGAALVEMVASASAGLWRTEIYRDAALAGVIYAAPSSEIAFIDNSGAGTFAWTARSVNVSNINSTSDAGPVTATIA